MQLETGRYVIYRSSEICRIDSFEEKSFDGVTKREYCVLVPVDARSSKYYVPMDCAEEKLRNLLTKDEVLALIDGMKGDMPDWGENDPNRKDRVNQVLSSGDYRLIISLLHSLYLEKQKRIGIGKKLLAADEKAMRSAEQLINREFAFVLEIPENEIAQFISERISQ